MRIERVTKMFAEIEYSMKNDLASEQSDVPLYADVPTEPGSWGINNYWGKRRACVKLRRRIYTPMHEIILSAGTVEGGRRGLRERGTKDSGHRQEDRDRDTQRDRERLYFQPEVFYALRFQSNRSCIRKLHIDWFFFFYNSSEKRKNVKVCVCVMNIVHSAGSVHPWHKTLFPFFGHNIRQ